MSDYPTLPLADVLAYRPDGPVMLTVYGGRPLAEAPDAVEEARRVYPTIALLLDPTGCRSLAVAIAKAGGSAISVGVCGAVAKIHHDDIGWSLAIDSAHGRDYYRIDPRPFLGDPVLDADTFLVYALAAVARVVLGGSRA